MNDPITQRITDKLYGPAGPTREELYEQTAEFRATLSQALIGALRDVNPTSRWCAAVELTIEHVPDDEWDRVLRRVVEVLSGGNW
jgi:hypothetical protein